MCFLFFFFSGIRNADDNCVYKQNPYQWDTDDDGFGDECDNCRYIFNPSQSDEDDDLLGDECDTGIDTLVKFTKFIDTVRFLV